MMPILYFAGIAAILFFALRFSCGNRVMGHAASGSHNSLPITDLGWAQSLFLSITYVVCVAFDLLFPRYVMYETWAGLLPGFVWLTPTGFAIGLVESFLYGWYVALVFGGLYNALIARRRAGMTRLARPSLRFLGAAGTVTGSRYLVEAGSRRILVDCGLFQGFKTLRDRSRKPFPARPAAIDTVLLTHAHLDHSGYLPALIRAGFAGRVHCTEATAELCGLILPDSGHLQEEEARYAARKGFSKHRNPIPLYTLKDAEKALERFDAVEFRRRIDLGDGIAATFIPAGHLLGAAQIRLEIGGSTVHFSGDLGHDPDPPMRPPAPFEGADVVVCESTYGNRRHPDIDPEAELAPVLKRTFARGGTVLIPSFAVGRAQGLMYHVARLMARGEIPRVPVYLNSPMAIDATAAKARLRRGEPTRPAWEHSGIGGGGA